MTLYTTRLLKAVGARDADPGATAVRRRLTVACNVLVLLLALLAGASLIVEYGCGIAADEAPLFHGAQRAVLAGFACLTLAKLGLAEKKRQHLKERRPDLAVAGLILAYLAAPEAFARAFHFAVPGLSPDALASVLVAAMQGLVVLAFVPATLRASRWVMSLSIPPSLILVLGFAAMILAGAGLLLLPNATPGAGIAPVDALFTATSAVCVTGLVVVDTANAFTHMGHWILLGLIQAGGLGILVMTALMAMLAGGQTHLKESAQIRTMLEETKLGTIRRTVFRIVAITFTVEEGGALLLYASLPETLPAQRSSVAFFSFFHSVSAFCNAGFGLLPANCAEPGLRDNVAFLTAIMALVVVGGLGIPVLTNVGAVLARRRQGPRRARLSLHAKIVLSATAVLLAGGAAVIALIEAGGALRGKSFPLDLVHALFLSASSRTAGFNALDMSALGPATLYFLCLLMWVGASPASTGGGVKTTTLVVALANIHALVTGRDRLELFRRRVPELAVTRAFSTVALSFFFIAGMVFLLLLTEGAPLQDLLFEVVSATGTVGLSTGITPRLSAAGKLLIVACMFAGRVGILSLVLALVPARGAGRADRTEEPVLIT